MRRPRKERGSRRRPGRLSSGRAFTGRLSPAQGRGALGEGRGKRQRKGRQRGGSASRLMRGWRREPKVLQQNAEGGVPAASADSPASTLRVVAIVVLAVIVQTTVAPYLTVLGARPDVTMVVVVSIALMRGPVWGAVTGFSGGLLLDIALLQTMGISSFLYTLAGYFSGRAGERIDPASWFPPLVTVFVATLVVQILNSVIMFLLGEEASIGFVMLRIVLPTALINGLVAAPIFAFCRWWLRIEVRQNVFSGS